MDDRPSPPYLPPMSHGSTNGVHLSGTQRSTLEALTRSVLPHLFESSSGDRGLARMVEQRLEQAPPQVAGDLATALDVLGSSLGGLVVTGRPVRFAEPPRRDARASLCRLGHFTDSAGSHRTPGTSQAHPPTWYATDAARTSLV